MLGHWVSPSQHFRGSYCHHLHGSSIQRRPLLDYLMLADHGTQILQNVWDHLPSDIASHPKRRESLATPLWEPQILQTPWTIIKSTFIFAPGCKFCNNSVYCFICNRWQLGGDPTRALIQVSCPGPLPGVSAVESLWQECCWHGTSCVHTAWQCHCVRHFTHWFLSWRR